MSMIPYNNRLKDERVIRDLYKKGRGSFGRLVGLKYLENGTDDIRFVVMVGKKVHKSAVKRNLIRRRIKAVLMSRIDDIRPGFDIAVIGLGNILDSSFSEIEEAVLGILKKSGLLTDEV